MKLISLVLAIFLFASHEAWSFDDTPIEEITLDSGDANLKGVHYLKNPKGEPVLFMHGIIGTRHMFNNYVPHFLKGRANVFKFHWRGHGNDSERSLVKDYRDGDYRFEHMVEKDLPTIIDHIFEKTGKKVTIIGHSMGGMVAINSNGLGRSADKVAQIVPIGSPPHFRDIGLKLTMVHAAVKPFLNSEWAPETIPLKGFNIPENLPAQFNGPLIQSAINMGLELLIARNPLFDIVAGDVLNSGYFEPSEISKLAPAFSDPHRDILKSFADYLDSYPYEKVKVNVPVLYVLGTRDRLAPYRSVLETAEQQATAGYEAIVLNQVSHMDLLSEKVAKVVSRRILRFMNKPSERMPGRVQTVNLKQNGLLNWCGRKLNLI